MTSDSADLLDALIVEWVMHHEWGIVDDDQPLPAHSERHRRALVERLDRQEQRHERG